MKEYLHPFGPDDGGDGSEGEEPEPEVYIKWEESVEHEIVTQRLMFSGGGERTITFDKKRSFSHGNEVYGYRVPYYAIDFNGEITATIEVGDVSYVDAVEKDTVYEEKTRSAWADKKRMEAIKDDESKKNVRIVNLRVN